MAWVDLKQSRQAPVMDYLTMSFVGPFLVGIPLPPPRSEGCAPWLDCLGDLWKPTTLVNVNPQRIIQGEPGRDTTSSTNSLEN